MERAIHGLATGLTQIPVGVDPGVFIVSGGVIKQPAPRRQRTLSLAAFINTYLANQAHKAPTTAYTEGVHLRNFMKELGDRAEAPADRLAHRDLESYIQARLRTRRHSTVEKERSTIIQFFRWAVAHGQLGSSPAVGMSPIQGQVESAPSRTIGEIEAIIARGGLSAG